jgi:hypothetical protein
MGWQLENNNLKVIANPLNKQAAYRTNQDKPFDLHLSGHCSGATAGSDIGSATRHRKDQNRYV